MERGDYSVVEAVSQPPAPADPLSPDGLNLNVHGIGAAARS